MLCYGCCRSSLRAGTRSDLFAAASLHAEPIWPVKQEFVNPCDIWVLFGRLTTTNLAASVWCKFVAKKRRRDDDVDDNTINSNAPSSAHRRLPSGRSGSQGGSCEPASRRCVPLPAASARRAIAAAFSSASCPPYQDTSDCSNEKSSNSGKNRNSHRSTSKCEKAISFTSDRKQGAWIPYETILSSRNHKFCLTINVR